MRILLLLSSTILLITGCSRQETKIKDPLTMSFNNTELNEWTGIYSTKNSEIAHSGKTVAFLDSSTIYSMGYLKSLENISKTKIDSVVFSYWIFCKNNKAKAKTVISIDKADNTKNLFWVGNPIEDKVKEYNKWVFVSESFVLPPNMDTKNILKLYVWNNSKEEILLDDLKVEFY